MNQKLTLLTGALLGTLGVAIGAFGAHALKNVLTQNGRAETFELAVRYQFYHALALIAVGILMDKFNHPAMSWASLLFLAGVVFFSGSLYAYSLTNAKVFAMVTPIGGIFLLVGWGLLAYSMLANR